MPNTPDITPDQIKKWVVTAIISDDELFEYLVLKGGNAIDLIHHIAARASIDIDFSMQADFPGGSENLALRIERALKRTFRQYGYEVFDFKFHNKPEQLSADVADFWGGYKTEFKLVGTELFRENAEDLELLRKHALNIGQGKKFLIDISRHEYVEGRVAHDFDGYIIYVYSPVMIVCEKLRAICQQMPEYGPVVNRTRPGSARARDFYDIYQLVTLLNIDIESDDTTHILSEIFRCKKVNIAFLDKIGEQREFHRPDFPSVQNTVPSGVAIESFDFYFDFTLGLVEQLKTFRNK
ncbi:nucleotidyl transferase AbiEii/AbiGii toxin family protein [Advenella sp. FME57]|uniref:nucleotidyl transferase AbiEii/AbiGii toxin family protein n=1 Tax=Advenella sp. FME57 TaxID=2742604 RepID=UPI00186748C1|nr:nucleotidyl transferase AbiEii/AbiGii toxin family protein [Advenella sp. FME57]